MNKRVFCLLFFIVVLQSHGWNIYYKSQVEAMGGHIEVESEETKGTTFKIRFKA